MSDYQKQYAAMSPEEKAAMWDAYHGLNKRTWNMYECSDCDPEFADVEDPEDERHKYDNKAMIVLPADIERPDYCPRCESYLSLGEPTVVCVTRLGSSKETTPESKEQQ